MITFYYLWFCLKKWLTCDWFWQWKCSSVSWVSVTSSWHCSFVVWALNSSCSVSMSLLWEVWRKRTDGKCHRTIFPHRSCSRQDRRWKLCQPPATTYLLQSRNRHRTLPTCPNPVAKSSSYCAKGSSKPMAWSASPSSHSFFSDSVLSVASRK